MTADNPTRRTARLVRSLQGSRQRLRSLARGALWRWARPYARRRARRAEAARSLSRLESVVERHSEQIERLEDLGREIVLTAESLRREIARGQAGAAKAREEAGKEGGSEG
jgi:hypothetical protein